MTTDTDLLEQIVSGVMQRLTSMSGEVRSNGSVTTTDENTEQTGRKTASNELLLTDNVITADLLSEQLGEVSGWLGSNEVSPQSVRRRDNLLHPSEATRLSIGPTSVLTPSARDWLRERHIDWRRQTQSGPAIAQMQGSWKIIVEHSTPAVQTAFESEVNSTGHRLVTETADDFSAAVRSAVSSICRAEADGVVLFTDKPAAAACLANRIRKVRAAAAMGATCVRAARRQMGANLLCVDPTGRTVWELKTILRELKRSGRPSSPSGWQE